MGQIPGKTLEQSQDDIRGKSESEQTKSFNAEEYFGESSSEDFRKLIRFTLNHPTIDIEVPEHGVERIFQEFGVKLDEELTLAEEKHQK